MFRTHDAGFVIHSGNKSVSCSTGDSNSQEVERVPSSFQVTGCLGFGLQALVVCSMLASHILEYGTVGRGI